MMKAVEPREMGVLEAVMAGASGVKVVPTTETPLGNSLTVTLLTIMTSLGSSGV